MMREMLRLILLAPLTLMPLTACAQPSESADYRLVSVKAFVTDSLSGERTYGSLESLVTREGDYVKKHVQMEIRAERVRGATFPLRVVIERYRLLKSISDDYGTDDLSAYPTAETSEPTWMYAGTVSTPVTTKPVDGDTLRFVTGPIAWWQEPSMYPITYEISGYALRVFLPPRGLLNEDADLSNNAGQLELLYTH